METFRLLTALGWRNLWRNQRRTWITFTAIGVGVWSMVFLASLTNAWAMSTFNASINTLLGHGQIHTQHYLEDPGVEHRLTITSQLSTSLNQPAIKSWAPRVRVSAIVQSERESTPVTLVGISPEQERGLSFIADAITQGSYFNNDNDPGIILGQKLLKRLRTDLNKRVVLMSQDVNGMIAEQGFRIVGVFETDQKETETLYAFVSIKKSQAMLGIGDELSEISFLLNNLDNLPAYLDSLHQLIPELKVSAWFELEPFTLAILDMSDGTIAIWTITMFILVAFGLINTLLMAVFERTREFGLIQALGMRPRLIVLQVLFESVLLIGFGVFAGLVTGVLSIEYFSGGLDLGALAEGATMFGAGRVLYPEMDWLQGFYIVIFVWIMGVVFSLYPAWHASREVPVETINKSY